MLYTGKMRRNVENENSFYYKYFVAILVFCVLQLLVNILYFLDKLLQKCQQKPKVKTEEKKREKKENCVKDNKETE